MMQSIVMLRCNPVQPGKWQTLFNSVGVFFLTLTSQRNSTRCSEKSFG